MIICAECGASNGDADQFCGTCGEFLRWDAGDPPSGGRSTGADRPGPGPGTGDRPGAATDVEGRPADGRAGNGPADGADADRRPKRDPRAGGRTEDVATTAATTAGTSAATSAGTSAATSDGAAAGTSAGAAARTGAEAGRAVAAPDGTDPDPGGRAPAPRQPGAPDRRAEPADAAPVPVAPADGPTAPPPRLVCPSCAAENAPGRRFCRACGAELVAAAGPAAPRRTWWQRCRDRLRRRSPERRSLREQRRAAGAARRTLLIVLTLCLVGVLAIAGPPLVRRAIEAVRDRTQDPTPLVPAAVVASSEALGASAGRLTDGANNRYWAPNGVARGAWVEGRFAEPVRLLTVVITPGVSPRRQAFLAAGRPRGLTVIAVGPDGRQEKTDIELRDEPGEQHFDVPAAKVVRIRLVVRSTYGPGLLPSVAIGEAEFFGRR
ncbi:NADase-type glycan-binding domain-containing protein [Micromonospora sp. NPDC049836]|uniref:NADase-type glycan-binding domain-containing protein n=1 Tax=Micromonospora sp. NPDC049836 TaxID=3364274 RepID=UPI003796BA28